MKRVLRTKEGEDRITDYEKIIHICQERIRQLKFEKESIPVKEVREEDKKIREGDVFECIQHVIMEDGSVAYVKGKKYASEIDDCITDESHEEFHYWYVIEDSDYNWWHYFKRI